MSLVTQVEASIVACAALYQLQACTSPTSCVQTAYNRFKAILRTDSGWDGIGYTRSFDTVAGEWQTVDLPFSEFVPVFR